MTSLRSPQYSITYALNYAHGTGLEFSAPGGVADGPKDVLESNHATAWVILIPRRRVESFVTAGPSPRAIKRRKVTKAMPAILANSASVRTRFSCTIRGCATF